MAPGGPTTVTASTRSKLLLDPWAREIVSPPGGFDWRGPHFGADREHPQHMDTRDNGRQALKARVVHEHFDWLGDHPPATPLADTVIYETHVRGFSKRLPGVPEEQRGTYAGLASDAAIAHFQPPGHHRRQPAAGAADPRRGATGGEGPRQLLGLQHDRLLLPRPALRARRRGRATNSAPWSAACTRPASRCCSTSSSTTPPKATNEGRRSAGAGWTT